MASEGEEVFDMQKPKKILIVEDQKDMQTIYASYFAGEKGYSIEIASDGQRAIRKLDLGPFDLVIMDVIMDPMPGDTLFVYLKSVAETKNIPIIVVSVLGQELLQGFKKVEGEVHLLQKPITKVALFEEIDRILKGAK
jgi:twitching motility two-component system response regulator PilH